MLLRPLGKVMGQAMVSVCKEALRLLVGQTAEEPPRPGPDPTLLGGGLELGSRHCHLPALLSGLAPPEGRPGQGGSEHSLGPAVHRAQCQELWLCLTRGWELGQMAGDRLRGTAEGQKVAVGARPGPRPHSCPHHIGPRAASATGNASLMRLQRKRSLWWFQARGQRKAEACLPTVARGH